MAAYATCIISLTASPKTASLVPIEGSKRQKEWMRILAEGHIISDQSIALRQLAVSGSMTCKELAA